VSMRPFPPTARRLPPPFIDQGEVAYNHDVLLWVQCCSTSTRYLRLDGRLGESRPLHASWWLLCLSRGNFEGGRAGAHAWSSSVHRLEGPTDEGS
jgi:hypothetical protein